MKEYLIYKYTSPSGKSYIGQTCDLISRKQQHKKSKYCRAFHNAITKYGFENFIEEILEENLTLEEANIFEELYITEHNTLSPNGYNLQSGGNNKQFSKETLEKLRGENHHNFGKHLSEETKRRIGLPQIGENNHMYGKTGILHHNFAMIVSEETRMKSSKSHIGIKQSDITKQLKAKSLSKMWIIIFPDGHEEIITNLAEFCRNNNLNKGAMCKVSKNILTNHKKFICKQYIEYNEV